MIQKNFEDQCGDALLAQIDDLMRKRLDLVHDLIEVLARGMIRIERQLDRFVEAEDSQPAPKPEIRDDK